MINIKEFVDVSKIEVGFVYFDGETYHVSYPVKPFDSAKEALIQSLGVKEENLIVSTTLDFKFENENQMLETIFRIVCEKLDYTETGEVYVSYYRCLDIRLEESQQYAVSWAVREIHPMEELLKSRMSKARKEYETYLSGNEANHLTDVYDILYDEQDEYGAERIQLHETYRGNYQGLQQRLKQLKEEGKYHLNTKLLYSEEEIPEQQETFISKVRHFSGRRTR